MPLELTWKATGPARPTSTAVPPVSIGNDSYALVHDDKRQRLVYVRASDYAGNLEQWTWDGTRWERVDAPSERQQGHERHAYFDPDRGAVVVWTMHYDLEEGQQAPIGHVVDAKGIRTLATKGEPPTLTPPDDDSADIDIGFAMAFDAARRVTVCLTRSGVWELDGKSKWTRQGDAPGVPAEWHNDAGGTYDPVRQRCVFWLQEQGDKYETRLFTWDGAALSPLQTAGLPSLHMGLFDPCALFAGHPRHGLVVQIGGDGGMWALADERWQRLPDLDNVPPRIGGRFESCRPHMAVDPRTGTIVVGPGFHEGNRGSEPQDVFFVLRDNAWERHGVVARPSPLEHIYGTRRHAAVNGTWYATGYAEPVTMKWTADGWQPVVDAKTAEALVKRVLVAGLGATPEGLVFVRQNGSTYRLEGDHYEEIAKSSPDFKERTELLLVHDGKQLVAWGGKSKNRKSNDTFWLDGKTWRKHKQASPTPADFTTKRDEYIDFALVHDTTLGAIVRFGYREVGVLLDGTEVWQTAQPTGLTTLLGPRSYNHFPAHDPATGETLLVDFAAGRVVRFDLGRCTEVATFAYPAEHVEAAQRDHRQAFSWFADDAVYVPETRSIEAQRADDNWFRYTLDLGPAFEAARALGARKKLEAKPPAKKAPAAKAAPKGKPKVKKKK